MRNLQIRTRGAFLLFLYALPLLALMPLALVLFLILFIPLRIVGIRGFSLWPLLTLLGVMGQRRGAGAHSVPVRNVRLRDTEGREQQVRIKGRLAGGVADRGDPVLVWGRRRDGVLHLHHGQNLRTGARIRLQSTIPYGVAIPATIAWLAILWMLFFQRRGDPMPAPGARDIARRIAELDGRASPAGAGRCPNSAVSPTSRPCCRVR
ncbi:MAG: hypothetical protein IPP62_17900, partial [bacterium]|nr:hypothetical protein [bacterium]